MNRGERRKAIELRHRTIERIRIPNGELCDVPELLELAEYYNLPKSKSLRWPYPYLVRLSDRVYYIAGRDYDGRVNSIRSLHKLTRHQNHPKVSRMEQRRINARMKEKLKELNAIPRDMINASVPSLQEVLASSGS